MEELNPSHYPATRAVRVVVNYITYQHGTPHKIFLAQKVETASREKIEGVGHKYYLRFPITDKLGKEIVNCTAEVLYYLSDPPRTPEVNVVFDKELTKDTEAEDNEFYNKMKSQRTPIKAHTIPDNYGNVPPELEPVRYLAWNACGYVIWQNSTEDTLYSMARIETVQQVKRDDGFIEFNFKVLLHDFISQEMIPWQLQVLWQPENGTIVKQNSRLPRAWEK
ncbi:latexin [Microcaecilia unicolor]|uniref:Latexin n=1 Tax=Microcaecilia unicolor TaxID=1415580 RepID=A0A6P7Z828_9AMPH|nr:latexin [Microcaecilia unicolor]